MDISAQSWKRGVRYSKDDIVKIENLTNIDDFISSQEGSIGTNEIISIDAGATEKEQSYGGYFPVNPSWDY